MAKVANAAKTTIGGWWESARDTSAEIGVLLLQSPGESETALADRATVADILAGNTEATFTGYTRRVLPTVAVVRDDTANTITLTLAGTPPFHLLWPTAGGATNNTVTRVVYYHDPDPNDPDDTRRRHLASAPLNVVTDGSTIMVTINEAGIARAGDVA